MSSKACPNLKDGSCAIASELAGDTVGAVEANCLACSRDAQPFSINPATVGLAIGHQKHAGRDASELIKLGISLAPKVTPAPNPNGCGLGTALAGKLDWFNPQKTQGCLCGDYIGFMNRWTLEECRTPSRRRTMLRWLRKIAVKGGTDVSDDQLNATIDRAIAELSAGKPAATAAPPKPAADPLVGQWPFVWTYWAGGAVGEELRYSIRSVLHHHPTARVIVVGDRPGWYRGEFIPKPRIKPTSHHAFKDCYSKLLLAAEHVDRFVWMMDDIYWIKPFSIELAATPKYVRHVTQQRFKAWKPRNKWAATRARAYEFLLAEHRPTYDFAAHLPQPIVSRLFLENEQHAQLLSDYRNWECIYFNRYHAAEAIDFGRRYLRINKTVQRIETKHCLLNHTHSQYRGAVEQLLRETFGERSSVE